MDAEALALLRCGLADHELAARDLVADPGELLVTVEAARDELLARHVAKRGHARSRCGRSPRLFHTRSIDIRRAAPIAGGHGFSPVLSRILRAALPSPVGVQ